MTVQPLRDFLVVEKPAEEEKVGSGLLYKPQTSESKVVQSRVLAVGSGRVASDGTIVPLEVQVGDVVIFNRNFATELTAGSETIFLLREEHVFCVMR